MRRFFSLYQYLGPALLTPLAAWLWWRHYGGNAPLAALAVGVPVIHAYLVPGIGTNVLGMWAFNARLKLGRFRPQHGFVFGSATALIVLPLAGSPLAGADPAAAWQTGLAAGAVLLAVNWIYDALAIRHGVLEVYNQPAAESASAWAIAGDYVIWFFGLFGLIYGAGLKLAEPMLLAGGGWGTAFLAGAAMVAATAILPSACYVAASFLRHGHSGLTPVSREAKAP
ncbi:hypothetical protein [Zhengella mangrovi]|uniref:hypothetical protein n=1 Tax=Zhengella mangrovi TaxID=1982044 RepID=UPI0013FDF83B|nr:hypothetical protein [Zhengella mangrovi]